MVNIYVYNHMATVQVLVRLPKKMVKVIDRWVAEGRFTSRSEAVKTILVIYEERERTRAFYQLLLERSREAKKKPEMLVALDGIR